MHYLAMVTLGALPRASRTRYIELIRCLRLSRAALRSSRRRPSWSRLLLLLCGCVFVLFSLVHCSPVYADDYADPGRITAYTPAGSAFVNVSGGSVAFYSDYLWVTGSDVTQVTNFSTTKGLARKGDILAVSVYVWDNVDTFGSNAGSQYQRYRNYSTDGINWIAYGKPGYANLLAIRDNVAYFRCTSDEYCWAESVVNLHHKVENMPNRNYIISSYIISGEASKSEQAAEKELKQAEELRSRDNTGMAQQQGLNNSSFKTKSTSLISALIQVADSPATKCSISAPVHSADFSFNFCSGSRPSWLRPLISIPVAVTSILLSIHIIKTIASEIDKFRAGV